jgi:hypothetical protein
MSFKTILCSVLASSLVFFSSSNLRAEVVDIFISAGQSNAKADNMALGRGAEEFLKKSGKFSNVVVVKTAHGGKAVSQLHYKGKLKNLFHVDFFNKTETKIPMGALEAKIAEVIANGDTPVFRGMFWWQGESNGVSQAQLDSGKVPSYDDLEGIIAGISEGLKEAGLDDTKWNFILNKVYRKDETAQVNAALAMSAESPRGVLFDTQEGEHRTYKGKGDPVHGYNHFLVGQENAKLFIETFVKK